MFFLSDAPMFRITGVNLCASPQQRLLFLPVSISLKGTVVVPFGLLQARADYEPDNLPQPIREPFIRVAKTIVGSITAGILSVSPCDGNRYSNWTVRNTSIVSLFQKHWGNRSVCLLKL